MVLRYGHSSAVSENWSNGNEVPQPWGGLHSYIDFQIGANFRQVKRIINGIVSEYLLPKMEGRFKKLESVRFLNVALTYTSVDTRRIGRPRKGRKAYSDMTTEQVSLSNLYIWIWCWWRWWWLCCLGFLILLVLMLINSVTENY